MVIADKVDVKLALFDIEAYVELFSVGIYDPDTKEYMLFEVSKDKNQLEEFLRLYLSRKYDYWVSFNGIGYDNQLIEMIIKAFPDIVEMNGGLEIARFINSMSTSLIDDQMYELQPPFREDQFSVKVIDLFRIHHFDNPARRCSLKWCEFMMNLDVHETPIAFDREDLTTEEIKDVLDYMEADVMATYKLLLLTLGETDVEELASEYGGKNKIQDRFDVMAETKMYCLNWSDVKIGEEWNKLNYIKEENLSGTDISMIYNKKPIYPYGKKFSQFFPPTMSFTTKRFKDFISDVGEKYVLPEKQEFPLTIGNNVHNVAKGGVHSNEKHRYLKPPPGYYLIDADVGGQYPNFIIKNRVYPPHLKSTIIGIAQSNVEKRSKYKKMYQQLKSEGKVIEARPYNGLQEMLKLCNNGGLFGKLGQEGSFLHYPEGLLRVCLGNEIEILMLIEMMENEGFTVVSSNTDGIQTLIPIEREKRYLELCTEWEGKVGNEVAGKLEYTYFDEMWQESINHYIGKKNDGTAKKKGRFSTSFQLNKNKSALIIPLALEQYFINKVNPIDFIKSHTNIFDFCIGKKAWKDRNGLTDLWYVEKDGEKEIEHRKIIRYYVSTKGCSIKKVGFNKTGLAVNSYCEAPDKDFFWMKEPLLKSFNKFEEKDNYDIDYSYYIIKTLKIIDNISKTRMATNYADTLKAKQYTLF